MASKSNYLLLLLLRPVIWGRRYIGIADDLIPPCCPVYPHIRAKCFHARSCRFGYIHTRAHTHNRARTHTRAHTYTRAQARTHAQTHTHTHTRRRHFVFCRLRSLRFVDNLVLPSGRSICVILFSLLIRIVRPYSYGEMNCAGCIS